MDYSIRKEPIPLSCLSGGKRFCIFAKIQEGQSQYRLFKGNAKWRKLMKLIDFF